MTSTLFLIITSTILVSLVSLLVGTIFIFKKNLPEIVYIHLLSLAAGILLATAILDLLPEATKTSVDNTVYLSVIFGIVLFFISERFLLWFHHHDETHGLKPAKYLILTGDSMHNLLDGIAIGVAFTVSNPAGIITTLAVAGHEIPQELADLTILLKGGMKLSKALFFNLITGFFSIIGGVLSFWFANVVSNAIPLLLGFTAGMFIYISASDLIPELHLEFLRDKRWHQAGLFITGIILVWLLGISLNG